MKAPQRKILFIVQLPPPVHGVSVMNRHAVENPYWEENYIKCVLPLNFGQTLEDIGKVTPGKVLRMARFLFKLLYTLITFQPSVVYFTIMPTGKVFFRDAVFTSLIKLFRAKVIFHLHGKGVKEAAEQSGFKKWIYKQTFNGVYIICLSERLKEDVACISDRDPFLLPNGIENKHLSKAHIINEPPVILYLSNLVKSKGIQVLLNSLVQLKQQNIAFSARIVGDSVDYTIEEAKTFCAENGIADMVLVLGPKYNEEKLQQFQEADIFVLPSFNECFPLSILEAMQSGLPVVATTVGGIPDIITDGNEGLLTKVNNIEDLTEKLRQLLLDDHLRHRLGSKASQKFRFCYTIEQFHKNLYDIVEEVLKRP